MIRSTERACFLRPRLNPPVKLYPSLATGRSCLPLRGRPAPCHLPPGCSSPWEGHWVGTWAAEAPLPSACLTNFVTRRTWSCDHPHSVGCLFLMSKFSVNKLLAGSTPVCLSVSPCDFSSKSFWSNLGSQPFSSQNNLT